MTATKSVSHRITLGVVLLLAGCATQPISAYVPPTSRLTVLDLPPSISDNSLQRTFHPQTKQISTEALASDRQQIEQQVEADLKQALAKAGLPLLAEASIVSTDNPKLAQVGQPLDAATLTELQAKHPADVYLRVKVTDFGETPKSWEGAYIGFEVVTTLAIAGALYVHTVTRPLAGAYLVEESVEEFSEGYAGFWLLNRISRPVRIEADLVDGKTGAVLWHDNETGLADWHWDHVWHMDDTTRDRLLTESTDHAVKDLVQVLEGH